MILEKIANRKVATVNGSENLKDAAKIMRDKHVGSLVVVKKEGVREIPIGMLTDRDIVVSTCAFGIPPDGVLVKDVMSSEFVSAKISDSFYHVLHLMKEHGIHRIPIVDSSGGLTGIVSSRELLAVLSDELGIVVQVADRQHEVESERRPHLL
jgi:CBS domain-containing protein